MTTAELTTTEVTTHADEDGSAEYTTAMMYGYGTAAVAVISSLSLLGILLFPVLKNRSHEYVLQFFIALGIGTMTADALLHILPDVLVVPTDETDGEQGTLNVWKMSAVYGGIYFFFFLEGAVKIWRRNRTVHHHHHHHDGHFEEGPSVPVVRVTRKNDENVIQNPAVIEDNATPVSDTASTIGDTTMNASEEDDQICFGFKTVIFTVLFGDTLHNVTDGIAIGVSFAESAPAGIGTSLAILFHEIPHELGDFAIFLKNGASKWQAIGLNAIGTTGAFIGLYIGIAVSQDEYVRTWILAFVAGTFLYIALVQVMTEMTRHSAGNVYLQFFLQNIGFLLGWTMMLLLALYEDAIESSFTS